MNPINIELIKRNNETLRDYQVEAKENIYNNWANYRSLMLQMPTGTGKTRLFTSIVKDIHQHSIQIKKAIKVLLVAHREELINQISENIGKRYGIAHGIIKSGYTPDLNKPVQLASIQTFTRRINDWENKDFNFIVIDEAHHSSSRTYRIL